MESLNILTPNHIELADLHFMQGNTFAFAFQRADKDNNPIKTKADYVWFTIRKNTEDEVVIQKTLNDGITFDEDGIYHCIIKPKDSIEISGFFVWDIKVQVNDYAKTIKEGTLEIKEAVTKDYVG